MLDFGTDFAVESDVERVGNQLPSRTKRPWALVMIGAFVLQSNAESFKRHLPTSPTSRLNDLGRNSRHRRRFTSVPNPDEQILADDGLEIEGEDPVLNKQPFDPEKIRVRTIPVVVDQIVSRIDHEEIDLTPDFQRNPGIWDRTRKSRLIESLLLRIPLPVFYVAADENEIWSVVDGLQRISTIYTFIKGDFRLSGLEYLCQSEGLKFEQISRHMQRRIRETQLGINVIDPGTPEEVMFNIFQRINTGGMILTGQEIRNAMHPGPVRDFLRDLAESDVFMKATGKSISPDRMADRECVLRFLAFHMNPWEQYSAPDLSGYLGRSMQKINSMRLDRRSRLAYDFSRAMRTAYGIFGRHSFRKIYCHDDRIRPVSKALFEAWSVGFARQSDGDLEVLQRQKHTVIGEFIDLMNNDKEFEDSITYSTGSRKRVKKRFETVGEIIERCLAC